MADMVNFDSSTATRIETMYAAPEIAATRSEVSRAAAARSGEHGIDVGCGPGYLTRDLGLAVGRSGSVVAVDASDSMLDGARRRCAGLAQVKLAKADAGAIPVETGALATSAYP